MSTGNDLVAGRYRLGDRIGSGAMGVVWQAHDERLHRTVALKQLLLQPGLSAAASEEARQRCMREGRIAARLQHPNAITVYDVAEHDGEPWLVMEYLPSRSLATVLAERSTLSVEEAARIGTEVAAALSAAHTAGIVHRDVKPANVLLGDDGTVKITDFGISRATGDVTVTATGMLAGTPAYLAPEVAKGETPTPAADVFSLGSTLYTAVEGHSPFGLSENTLALLHAVAAGKITPPRQAGPMTALLMRLLRTDPRERPSMPVVKDALADLAAGRPALLGAPSPPAGERTVNLNPAPVAYTPPRPMPAQGPPTPQRGGTRIAPVPQVSPAAYRPPTPATPPHGQPVQPPREKSPSNARAVVLTVLAIVAAAAIGILVTSLLFDKDDNSGQAGQLPQTSENRQAVEGTTVPSPTTTTETTTTTTTETTTTKSQPTEQDYINTVRTYYGMLPANHDGGWALLTEKARKKSGGRASYDNFLNGLASVKVIEATAQGNRVHATIEFHTKDGRTTREGYVFVLKRNDQGTIMIDDFAHAKARQNR
ncbi:serine/threonine-protein kinase [Labedaea rhizosphaerae]|uniref:non-specific serine/threonine protein kinase n=1 Tax=Labedaea rhizosphaerae TaxID=598644 RepID=A0A4R6SMV9_LABRH|nr:serine/threonine-protein kinase [Labedaea rhizosphaerae]TDQ05856.1 serine/threonine protein kinase [Labedaea rhizosphaerae]